MEHQLGLNQKTPAPLRGTQTHILEWDKQSSVWCGGYDMLSILGRGATSTVYLATRTLNGTMVAIKVIDPGHEQCAQVEMRTSQQLGRTRYCLAASSMSVTEQGRLSLVFDQVGVTLQDVLGHNPRGLSSQAVRIIGEQVLRGVEEMHSRGLVHLDVKDSNILVLLPEGVVREHYLEGPNKHCPSRTDGGITAMTFNWSRQNLPDGSGEIVLPVGALPDLKVVLADLGMASQPRPQARTDLPMGSITFAAPEVVLQRGFSFAADVWSCHVLLRELATGRKLFARMDLSSSTHEQRAAFILDQMCAQRGPLPSSLQTARQALYNGQPLTRTVPYRGLDEDMQTLWSKKERLHLSSLLHVMGDLDADFRPSVKVILAHAFFRNVNEQRLPNY